MAITYLKNIGVILVCDYENMLPPEMEKRRPVVVLARASTDLCVVVPLSTTVPRVMKPWHYNLALERPLPRPYTALSMWAKCDMVNTVSFKRLSFLRSGKDALGKRILDIRKLPDKDFHGIQLCVASAIFPCPVDFLRE